MGAVIVGGILRFAGLSLVPAGLYCDEAFQGYEAYCLIRTGADSRGVPFPLFFDIFGVGWQEPLYIYLTTIPVRILGTTEAATRMAAAVAGTLSLAAVGWLASSLGGMRAAAGACALMAVSPWAFHFSRVGFQASLLPLFLAAGAAALLRGAGRGFDRDDNSRRGERPRFGWILIGAGVLTASLYTYVAARPLVPLLLLGFGVAFLKPMKDLGVARNLAVAGLIVALALPVAIFTLTPEGSARYQDVGLSSRYGGVEAAGRFLANYASYFSPSFLLTDGDPNLRHSVRGFGMLHAHDLVFLIAGLAGAALRRRPADLFLIWWLVVAPLPASLAADQRHAVRAIGAIPALYALAGAGAAALVSRGGLLGARTAARRIILPAILILAAASACAYLHQYFLVYPRYSGPAWQYGLKEAYREVEDLASSHDSIYVTRAEDFPYIHRLYLFAFPPEEYQKHRFSRTKYLFDEPVFYRGGLLPGRLNPIFLLKPHEVPGEGIAPRRAINYLDGSPAFVIAW